MDTLSNSTTAAEISTLILGTTEVEVAHSMRKNDLGTLSMEDLHSLLELLVALDDVTTAFLNQPRFSKTSTTLNRAGELADTIGTHLSDSISLVEQVAKEAKPRTSKEAATRAWLLLQRAAHYSEDLPRFLVAAAQLSVAVSNVEAA